MAEDYLVAAHDCESMSTISMVNSIHANRVINVYVHMNTQVIWLNQIRLME